MSWHPVVRIHCVVVLAAILFAIELFAPSRTASDDRLVAGLVAIAGLAIAASARSIAQAVRGPQA